MNYKELSNKELMKEEQSKLGINMFYEAAECPQYTLEKKEREENLKRLYLIQAEIKRRGI